MARKSGSLREEAERRGVSVYQVRNERLQGQYQERRRLQATATGKYRSRGYREYWTSSRITDRSRREAQMLSEAVCPVIDRPGSLFGCEAANQLVNPPADHRGSGIRVGVWQERVHRAVLALGLVKRQEAA